MYSNSEAKALTEISKNLLKDDHPIFKESVEKQLGKMRSALVFHEHRYYVMNEPLISDFEYDMIYKKLEAIEATHPELVTPDSPTQRVSNDLIDNFNTVPHTIPMLSLGNSYNAEDLKDFDERIKKLCLLPEEQEIEYVVEPKFDGGSIALIYENDQLVRGATRGNGTKGEEMTANARVIRSVPLSAAFSKRGIYKAELRGEVVIRKDVFDKMNEKRLAEGKELYANPRNTATGGLRQKDPKKTAQRGLVAFVYTFGYAADKDGNDMLSVFENHEESIAFLGEIGFLVPGAAHKLCKNITEASDFCKEWEAKRESYEYEVDGMVVKVNDRVLQEKSGSTGHHPRWAIAYKFKAKQATTKLLNVEYQVGKIGAITPVAKLEPVALAGVTIGSVSLHNEEFITDRDLHLGDTVLVERAGDVIPYIVKAMKDVRDGSEIKIEFPTHCPSCSTKLEKGEDEAKWRCLNHDCEAQVIQRLIHHVSKDAMDIEGFGKSIVERFYQMRMVRNIADIYRLDYEKIAELEGFGERSATNMKASIEKAKGQPIYRFLYSLSIHHLGKKVSKLLAAEIDHVLDLQKWEAEKYEDIKDIGKTVSQKAIEFFSDEKNIELLKEIESLGVNLSQTEDDRPKVLNEDGPFFGKTIIFTGKLLLMGRKEAQEKAIAAGAKNLSSVSSNLDILVAGEKAGSKLKKAQALGTVTIYTEEEFVKIIGE